MTPDTSIWGGFRPSLSPQESPKHPVLALSLPALPTLLGALQRIEKHSHQTVDREVSTETWAAPVSPIGDFSCRYDKCVHTGQYERLGGFRPFLRAYLRECIDPGYLDGPLEREAIERARMIVSG